MSGCIRDFQQVKHNREANEGGLGILLRDLASKHCKSKCVHLQIHSLFIIVHVKVNVQTVTQVHTVSESEHIKGLKVEEVIFSNNCYKQLRFSPCINSAALFPPSDTFSVSKHSHHTASPTHCVSL